MNIENENTVMGGVEDHGGKKYAEFTHSWFDPWEKNDIRISGRFARPTKEQLKRMQNKATRDPHSATYTLLVEIVHPDDREKLVSDLGKFPGVITTFGAAIIKAVGISAELGN